MNTSPQTHSARSSGQSQKGGKEALAGNPMRTAATRAKSRRCTTALTKCVVPITTPSIAPRVTSEWRANSASAVTIPVVTSEVVGDLTACTTRASSSSTASVLVPPTSIPIRRITPTLTLPRLRGKEWEGPTVEDRAKFEVVAEGAWPDVFEAFRRQDNRGRGEYNNGYPPAITDCLGAERFARHGVEHADQIGRHRDRRLVAPRHHPFILECDLQSASTVIIETLDHRPAAQVPLGCAAGDVDDLAAEEEFPLALIQDCRDRVIVSPLCFTHATADANRLSYRKMDAPILDLAAGARRLAGRGDRAELDADLTANPLHPLPARDLGHDRLDAARVIEHTWIGSEIADRNAGHLRFGIGAAHSIRVDDREPKMGSRHQRLDAVATADLERHQGAKFRAQQPLLNLDSAGDVAAVGQPLLADQRRSHIRNDCNPILIG